MSTIFSEVVIMNKINGYTEEEAIGLIEYIYSGKNAGKTLSYLFETYGKEHSRAKGSVRNYYYAFLKQNDERAKRILEGKNLTAGEIKPFTEEETEELLGKVLEGRRKGYSVRKSIIEAAGGDEKLMLRMQNKYRNLLKKEPERVERAAKKAGVANPFLQKRLEREIDALYARIAEDLRRENERLRAELEKLKET